MMTMAATTTITTGMTTGTTMATGSGVGVAGAGAGITDPPCHPLRSLMVYGRRMIGSPAAQGGACTR